MMETGLGREGGKVRQAGRRRDPLRIVSFCVKMLVALFPLPAAFLTGAPTEMKFAAVYATLVTLGLFLALAEIDGSVRRLAKTVEQQHESA